MFVNGSFVNACSAERIDGGVKASGLGRELGAGSVLAYTETKTIYGDVHLG